MSIIDQLTALLGSRHVLSDPDAMAPYLTDERALYQGVAACVALPGSTAEVATLVKTCAEAGYAIVPQGGNTGYCGGASPDGENQVLVNLSRLNRVREVDPVGFTATVEAGVILANLHSEVEAHDLFFPLSMGSEGSCQVGGVLSTNAGGLAVLKYGTAGELALGLEVVLPSGEVLDSLSPLRKDNTGYHLSSLFLGAEGTLGIITAATLKLFPRPTEYQTAWLAVRDVAAACELLGLARAMSGDTATSFEYISRPSLELVTGAIEGQRPPLAQAFDHQVLLELSGSLPVGRLQDSIESLVENAMERGLVLDGVLAESGEQRKALWRLRELIPEAEKLAGRSIKHDVSVTIGRIPDFLSELRRRLNAVCPHQSSIYGHIGDGNLHYNVMAPTGHDPQRFRADHAAQISSSVHELASEMQGSFSAEHGIGKLKRDDLAGLKDRESLQLMRALKSTLDPQGIMNPGKLL